MQEDSSFLWEMREEFQLESQEGMWCPYVSEEGGGEANQPTHAKTSRKTCIFKKE